LRFYTTEKHDMHKIIVDMKLASYSKVYNNNNNSSSNNNNNNNNV